MAAENLYNANYHDAWAWSLAMKGATNKEIADAFGITARTLARWYEKYVSFQKSMDDGRANPDTKVEQSLYRRAIGYEVEETETIIEMDKDGNQKPARIRRTKRHIPAENMAMIYWLNNRKRKTGEWSQRQELDMRVAATDEKVVFVLPEIEK